MLVMQLGIVVSWQPAISVLNVASIMALQLSRESYCLRITNNVIILQNDETTKNLIGMPIKIQENTIFQQRKLNFVGLGFVN